MSTTIGFRITDSGLIAAVAASALAIVTLLACVKVSNAMPPPPMPPSFDRSTVQNMVDNIETGCNTQLLKVGYFNFRTRPVLPRAEGYVIVDGAANGAAIGSHRWFCLESLKAYAAFNMLDPVPTDGFAAYDSIFDNATLAQGSGAAGELEEAVKEYVFNEMGSFAVHSFQKDPACGRTLAKAWSAYSVYLSANPATPPEPPWPDAVKFSNSEKLFEPLLHAQIRDPHVKKTYAFLSTAAAILVDAQPELALALLRQARTQLPSDIATEDEYFDLLVHAGGAAGRPKYAIVAQRDRVKTTGHGNDALLKLYAATHDWGAISDLTDAYMLPVTNEGDLNDVCVALQQAATTDKFHAAWAMQREAMMIQAYLATKHTRDIQQDLRARADLASIYLDAHDYANAASVANITVDAATPISLASAQYLRKLAFIRSAATRRQSISANGDTSK